MSLRPQPTIRDVAARAGVSIATVSRSLNASALANVDTAERVRLAAKELGFTPNPAGRALKTARSRMIGVMVPSLRNPVFADALAGIETAANAAGYGVIVASCGYAPEREIEIVEGLIGRRVDGLILTVADAARAEALGRLARAAMPYALLYNEAAPDGARAVSIDNAAAASMAAQALIARGHRILAMLAGEFAASDRQAPRSEGFLAAARAAGLSAPPVLSAPFGARHLGDDFAALFAPSARPTGLFCATDMLAFEAIRALKALGLDVPRDVSVVGFDGIDIGELISPSLATIVQPNGEMGEAAFAFLENRIEGREDGARVSVLPFHFRPGESLGPAPTQGDPK
ncbi:MAG: LacI family DNA-binding transcriptional regulator [Tagaea sp.]|nr:LacI family DNA-binding transcriptional regulator [Tagaea sp.]